MVQPFASARLASIEAAAGRVGFKSQAVAQDPRLQSNLRVYFFGRWQTVEHPDSFHVIVRHGEITNARGYVELGLGENERP